MIRCCGVANVKFSFSTTIVPGRSKPGTKGNERIRIREREKGQGKREKEG